jgi:chemotaxis protein methyltransferase CheR
MDLFDSPNPPVKILATDLDTNVLKKAETGIYPMERVEKLPPAMLKRYFLKGSGANEGNVLVREVLRNMITFRQLNLLDDHWPIEGPFDAIFCRNVMIYFDKPTQYKILQKFIPLMHRDALMFAGHSESFQHAADLFHTRGRTVYQIAEESRHLAEIPK